MSKESNSDELKRALEQVGEDWGNLLYELQSYENNPNAKEDLFRKMGPMFWKEVLQLDQDLKGVYGEQQQQQQEEDDDWDEEDMKIQKLENRDLEEELKQTIEDELEVLGVKQIPVKQSSDLSEVVNAEQLRTKLGKPLFYASESNLYGINPAPSKRVLSYSTPQFRDSMGRIYYEARLVRGFDNSVWLDKQESALDFNRNRDKVYYISQTPNPNDSSIVPELPRVGSTVVVTMENIARNQMKLWVKKANVGHKQGKRNTRNTGYAVGELTTAV